MAILSYLLYLLALIIPMFVTDKVALGFDSEEGHYIICLREFTTEDDLPFVVAYGEVKALTWLGWSFYGKEAVITEEV